LKYDEILCFVDDWRDNKLSLKKKPQENSGIMLCSIYRLALMKSQGWRHTVKSEGQEYSDIGGPTR